MIAGTRETLLDLERSSNCWRRWRNAGREESSSADEDSKLSKSTRMVNHQPKPSQQPLTKTNRCHPTKLWKSTRRRVNHQPKSSQQPPTKVNRCQPTKHWVGNNISPKIVEKDTKIQPLLTSSQNQLVVFCNSPRGMMIIL